jgi:hypothetical protein
MKHIETDEFAIIVPPVGRPHFAEGQELVEAVAKGCFRTSKTVALNSGRPVSGSIYKERETNASDEMQIFDLLASRFAK